MKPIQLSAHAREQMVLRGASEDEIQQAIQSEPWAQTKRGKWKAKHRFTFGKLSPVNQKEYIFKEVEPVFVDETDAIVVVTVMVYYSNEEVTP